MWILIVRDFIVGLLQEVQFGSVKNTWLSLWLSGGEQALPLLAAGGFKWSSCEPNHWCVMVQDWAADVSAAGHSVCAHWISTLCTFSLSVGVR